MLIDDVRLALQEAADGQPFSLDYTQAIGRSRRIRRRRRRAAATGLLAAVLAIAAGIGVAVTRGHDRPFVVRPANPSARPAVASVSGVDVTWLPAAFRAVGRPHVSKQLESGEYGLAERFSAGTSGSAPYLELDVVRGDVDLSEVARNFGAAASWTTVHGGRALLLSLADPAKLPGPGQFLAPAYVLQWIESDHPHETLRLEASVGTTLQELRNMAQGLVVRPLPGPPANPESARASVRQAFVDAFERVNPATVLPAIENGNDLAAVLNQLEKRLSRKEAPFSIRLGQVNFFDASHAWVDLSVSYPPGGRPNIGERASAVLIDGAWKVSESSYCSVIGATNLSCP